MKIYIATSWKMREEAMRLTRIFREDGHEVDCFCDGSTGRYFFPWPEVLQDKTEYDAVTFLEDPRARRAFDEDRKHIDWCDAVVMIFPCGRSAHLEAGYAKGRGKLFYMIGEFPPGEFDVMYGFADALFRSADLGSLRRALSTAADSTQ